MAKATSNIHEITSALGELADGFLFTSTFGRKLAADIADAVEASIEDRSLNDQRSPDGEPWKENEPIYKERKGGKRVGVLTGEMLSNVQLRGEREVDANSLEITYGTNEEVRRRAEWFTNGSDGDFGGEKSGAKGQPPRPFWGLDDSAHEAIDEVVERHADDVLGSL